jgi:hypothetical protein
MTIEQQGGPRLDPCALEERRVLERARSNPAEFAPIYGRSFARIYTYCLRRVGRAAEAEDLSSLVFTRALAGLEGYQGGSVAAWPLRIAHDADPGPAPIGTGLGTTQHAEERWIGLGPGHPVARLVTSGSAGGIGRVKVIDEATYYLDLRSDVQHRPRTTP